jgi:hypothetical protein
MREDLQNRLLIMIYGKHILLKFIYNMTVCMKFMIANIISGSCG